MTDLELKRNMCQVMAERDSFTLETLTLRLDALRLLTEVTAPGLYPRAYKQARRRVAGLLTQCQGLFEHVDSTQSREYRLACPLALCLEKLMPSPAPLAPGRTAWERLGEVGADG